jgi:hypothetical protein
MLFKGVDAQVLAVQLDVDEVIPERQDIFGFQESVVE